jgi:hypothetical protein
MNQPLRPYHAVIQSKGTHNHLVTRFNLMDASEKPVFQSTPLVWSRKLPMIDQGGIHDAYVHGVVSLTDPAVPGPDIKTHPNLSHLAELLAGDSYPAYKIAKAGSQLIPKPAMNQRLQSGLSNGILALVGHYSKNPMLLHSNAVLTSYMDHYKQQPQHLNTLHEAEQDYVQRFRHARRTLGQFDWTYSMTQPLTQFIIEGNNKALALLHRKWPLIPKDYDSLLHAIQQRRHAR